MPRRNGSPSFVIRQSAIDNAAIIESNDAIGHSSIVSKSLNRQSSIVDGRARPPSA